jgi:hypothetical protein
MIIHFYVFIWSFQILFIIMQLYYKKPNDNEVKSNKEWTRHHRRRYS